MSGHSPEIVHPSSTAVPRINTSTVTVDSSDYKNDDTTNYSSKIGNVGDEDASDDVPCNNEKIPGRLHLIKPASASSSVDGVSTSHPGVPSVTSAMNVDSQIESLMHAVLM